MVQVYLQERLRLFSGVKYHLEKFLFYYCQSAVPRWLPLEVANTFSRETRKMWRMENQKEIFPWVLGRENLAGGVCRSFQIGLCCLHQTPLCSLLSGCELQDALYQAQLHWRVCEDGCLYTVNEWNCAGQLLFVVGTGASHWRVN
jgi:hypothetical protein